MVSTMRRIHDAEHRLLVTNQRFAALRGGAGISRLDLFGAAERRAGPLSCLLFQWRLLGPLFAS